MIPDAPEAPDYPASPWQTVGLVAISIVALICGLWGGIDIGMRITGWLTG